MTLRINEAWKSADGSIGKDSDDEYNAIVTGDPDPATDNADNEFVVTRFAAQHFSFLSSLNNLLTSLGRERIAPGVWRFTAKYTSETKDRQTNTASFSFTTGGGTQHITHSRKTVSKTAAAGVAVAPDTKGGINATNTSVEGIDVDVAIFDFKTTFYVAPDKMTTAYMKALYALTDKVNSDAVTLSINGVQFSFQPGELRFKGADGSERIGFADWELTLNWSALPNANVELDGFAAPIAKDGWDYLWISYKPEAILVGQVQGMTPLAAYVDRVYERQPLTPLIPAGFTAAGQSNIQPWARRILTPGGGLS